MSTGDDLWQWLELKVGIPELAPRPLATTTSIWCSTVGGPSAVTYPSSTVIIVGPGFHVGVESPPVRLPVFLVLGKIFGRSGGRNGFNVSFDEKGLLDLPLCNDGLVWGSSDSPLIKFRLSDVPLNGHFKVAKLHLQESCVILPPSRAAPGPGSEINDIHQWNSGFPPGPMSLVHRGRFRLSRTSW